jgi:hypothetical protein
MLPGVTPSLLSGPPPILVGQQTFSGFSGSQTFTVPGGVTSICAVVVSPGARSEYYPGVGGSAESGSGGALAWGNNIAVTPGEVLTVDFFQNGTSKANLTSPGAPSSISNICAFTRLRRADGTYILLATAGEGFASGPARSYRNVAQIGGTNNGGEGGRGQYHASSFAYHTACGGGGAAGYSGNGGNGGGNASAAGDPGAGGGGAGGEAYGPFTDNVRAGAGGGVGLLGEGASGTVSSAPGSGGTAGQASGSFTTGPAGGEYGGGGGCRRGNNVETVVQENGGWGGCRIIWGPGRSYPSNAL